MEAMREKWTDGRLDDMNARMGEGFTRLDQEIRDLRSDMRAEFAAVRSEMAGYHRTILQLGGGMIATFVVGFAGIIAAQF
jgi:hypothetical protein